MYHDAVVYIPREAAVAAGTLVFDSAGITTMAELING